VRVLVSVRKEADHNKKDTSACCDVCDVCVCVCVCVCVSDAARCHHSRASDFMLLHAVCEQGVPDTDWGHDGFEALERGDGPEPVRVHDDGDGRGGRVRVGGGGRGARGSRTLAGVIMRSVVMQPEESSERATTLIVRNQARAAPAPAPVAASSRGDVRDRLGGKGPAVAALSTGTTIRVANLATSVTAEDMKVWPLLAQQHTHSRR